MSEMSKKLNKYYDREELWRKIYIASMIASVLFIISCLVFDIYFKYAEQITICFIIWDLFSLIVLLMYHYLYEFLLIKVAKKNNTLDSLVALSKTNDKNIKHNFQINYVLEGKFKDEKVYGSTFSDGFKINTWSANKESISSYTVIDETNKDQYSFWKGALGVALLGGVGAIAGVNGKNKKEYLIAIEWKSGDKSLILIDDEYYKVFVRSMF